MYVGLAYCFVGDVAQLFANELVLPAACFIFVVGHEAGHDERHCVLGVRRRYGDGADDESLPCELVAGFVP